MSVWIAGRAVPERDAGAADDRGLLLGDGLFETVLVRTGRAQHLEAHLGRLHSSADALGIVCPSDLAATLAVALAALWRAEDQPERAALRISLTRGRGRGLLVPPGAEPGLWIALSPLEPAVGGAPVAPVRAVIVDQPRIDPSSPLTGHKTLSALSWVLARRAAQARGADVALVRTLAGDVAEADAANLFAVLDGCVITPPLAHGVLPGITRARALAALESRGCPCDERPLAVDDILGAAELFLTSSLAGVTPVSAVGERVFEAPGPTAIRLAAWLGGVGSVATSTLD